MNIHIGALSELPSDARTIILIGSRSSDHLREIARILEWKGRVAYRIENASDLQPRWFSGVDAVGIVVGAANLQAGRRRARPHPLLRARRRAGHAGRGGAMKADPL